MKHPLPLPLHVPYQCPPASAMTTFWPPPLAPWVQRLRVKRQRMQPPAPCGTSALNIIWLMVVSMIIPSNIWKLLMGFPTVSQRFWTHHCYPPLAFFKPALPSYLRRWLCLYVNEPQGPALDPFVLPPSTHSQSPGSNPISSVFLAISICVCSFSHLKHLTGGVDNGAGGLEKCSSN